MPERLGPCLLLLAAVVSGCGADLAGNPGSTTEQAPLSSGSARPGTAAPTSAATPAASRAATGSPAATPDPAVLGLEAISCEGGVVLDWSPSTHPGFHHYTALRSPIREIAPDYPPIAPAVDWGDTYATDPFVTSAVDASILPSDTRWNYRVMAYDADGDVVSASRVRAARLREPVELGPLEVEALPDGRTRLAWTPYAGFPLCFSAYRITFGIGGPPSTVLTVVSDQATSEIETAALHPGMTYRLRVTVVRDTTLGSFMVGQSEEAAYTAP